MANEILTQLRFKDSKSAESADLSGIHTRNGDSIALHYSQARSSEGRLKFGFAGGFEGAWVVLDHGRKRLEFHTTDWRRAQPCVVLPLRNGRERAHVLRMEKCGGAGDLVVNANIAVFLDGDRILQIDNVNVLPEMGVTLAARGVAVSRLVHRGRPSGVPEYLRLGGWQMLNIRSIRRNMDSLQRGLEQASDARVELLVTPETCLTGLFPGSRVTRAQRPIADAEREIRRRLRKVKHAPYLVVGLPMWQATPGHERRLTRFNVSRVYDPDGGIVCTHAKIHSCEFDFWHGYRLQEFDVLGVPVCMHICHDVRYPEVWTLPVMFGARLILHPANGGAATGSIDAFEARAGTSTRTSHAFYIHVNGGGGSYIAGPQKYNNLLAVSAECQRDAPSFPSIGPAQECLIHAKVRVADAFGYWPVRSFRASEQVASSYRALYRAMGGRRRRQEPLRSGR